MYIDRPLPAHPTAPSHRNPNNSQPARPPHKLRRDAVGRRQQIRLRQRPQARPSRPMDRTRIPILQHSRNPVRARRAPETLRLALLQAHPMGFSRRRSRPVPDVGIA